MTANSSLGSRRPVLLDANVLLLLCLGLWNRPRMLAFRKARIFEDADFDLLTGLIRGDTVVTTPHIVTELSNLAGHHRDPERSQFFGWLAEAVAAMPEYTEPLPLLVAEPTFIRLGLTDAAVQRLARQNALRVITTDRDLYFHLLDIDVEADNFTYARGSRLLHEG